MRCRQYDFTVIVDNSPVKIWKSLFHVFIYCQTLIEPFPPVSPEKNIIAPPAIAIITNAGVTYTYKIYEIHHIVIRYLRFNATAFFYYIRLLLLGLLKYKYQSSFNIEMWQQCKSMTKSLRTAFRQSQINEMTIFESKIF